MYKTRIFLASIILLFVGSLLVSRIVKADDNTPVSQNETASVSIPPRVENFQSTLSSLDTQQTNIPPGVLRTYQITYGALKSASFPTTTTLVADFSDDKILGTDVVDYVPGSATDAYNSTHAVVDTINRTITWIFTLPPNTTDQLVTFQLKTNNNYTGQSPVNFTVYANMSNQYVTLPQQRITEQYLSTGNLINTPPTPTPEVSITPTPQVTATPTPAPTPAPLSITHFSFTTITDSQTSMLVTANKLANFSLAIGTTPTHLVQTAATAMQTQQTQLSLTNLVPAKTYYVQITAISGTEKFVSDIFTFTTAAISTPPTPENGIVVLQSNNNVVSSHALQGQYDNKIPIAVLPSAISFDIVFTLPPHLSGVNSVDAVLRNKYILGAQTQDFNDTETTIPMVEKEPGVYTAKLTTPDITGTYEVYVRITDTKGNLLEQKISEIAVVPPLTIVDNKTHAPIEDARVFFYFLNPQTNKYEPIIQFGNYENPQYSNAKGEVKVVLSPGKYKIDASALFYNQVSKVFIISGQPAPITLTLSKEPYNVLDLARFFLSTGYDLLSNVFINLLAISGSLRFFQLNGMLVTTLFIIITLFSFSKRIHIPLFSLPAYFFHMGSLRLLKKKLGGKISGNVYDEDTHAALPNATVYLIDAKKRQVLGHTKTDKEGRFSFSTLQSTDYILKILKDTFGPKTVDESEMSQTAQGYTIQLHKHEAGEKPLEKVTHFAENMFSLAFETLLVASFIFELALGVSFGFEKAAIFLFFSFGNVFLWVLSMTHLHSERYAV